MEQTVAVRDAGAKGRGVFALRPFKVGDRILAVRPGRIMTAAEARLNGVGKRSSCRPRPTWLSS